LPSHPLTRRAAPATHNIAQDPLRTALSATPRAPRAPIREKRRQWAGRHAAGSDAKWSGSQARARMRDGATLAPPRNAGASSAARRTTACRGMKMALEGCCSGSGPGLGSGDRDRGFLGNACWAGRLLDDGRSSPGFSVAAPATCPVALRARIRRCRLPTASPVVSSRVRRAGVRSVALDVHLDFCEVALVEDGELRSAGRIATTPERLELFAASFGTR
jgi:hypothetical protein